MEPLVKLLRPVFGQFQFSENGFEFFQSVRVNVHELIIQKVTIGSLGMFHVKHFRVNCSEDKEEAQIFI